MKKIISMLLAAVMCCGLFVGCGGGEKQAKEYTIQEFGEIYNKIDEEFEKETESFDIDEKYSEKGFEIYKKISEKCGLKIGAEVTVSGIKYGYSYAVNLTSEDLTYAVPCSFSDSSAALGVFIENGEEIKVSGVFSKDLKNIASISDIKILSPEVEPVYENNVEEAVASLKGEDGKATVCGKVTDIVSREEFKDMCSMFNMVELDENTFLLEKVAYVSNDGGKGMVFFSYSPEKIKDLEEGDEIALYGNMESIMKLLKADGTYETQWAVMDYVSELYNFKK